LKGEYSQALAEFQQVLNLPNDFRAKEGAHSYAQLGMGLVYHKQGEYEKSLEKVKASCSLGNASACSTLRDLGQL
jgi:tetratricopeptide (TPR) repeat protein